MGPAAITGACTIRRYRRASITSSSASREMTFPAYAGRSASLGGNRPVGVRARRVREGSHVQVCVYGDRGYNHGHPCLQVPHGHGNRTPPQAALDKLMSKVRVPIEWVFGLSRRLGGRALVPARAQVR